MKVLHLSDTHIKLLKEHDIYKTIFNEIYRIAKEQKVDAIAHTGDLFHTKIQYTPEAISMASDFLRSLADIAPLYIIPGNHDTNLKNNFRLDSITPIVEALNHKNIFYMKKSGEVDIGNNFVLNSMSLLDQENWKKPPDSSKINIALFHGSVGGIVLDNGQVLEHGEFDVSIFEGHDFAFLGDIHKSNQILDTEGRVRYCGSTVQQNFGESDDKGFLIWDIKGKNDFTCKHFAIPNPKPFVTFILNEDGSLPEQTTVKGARLRLMVDKNTTLDKIKKASEVLKNRFVPESITVVNKSVISKASQELIKDVGHTDNLRDLSVQERLIRDYLKDFKAEEEIIKKVLDLNKKFSSSIEEGEDILRGVKWSLKELEWDYLFNYGASNRINFDQLSGTVGIFGKNYSGKSSIVDSLIYTVFNTTSKNNRKNFNVINQNSDVGRGRAVFEIEDSEYVIERKSEKYLKKSKGVETLEAKTDVEFTSSSESLNGLARNDTDKNIRRFMGSVDDFFLTSMASQFGYLSFISEGSTKRKEILAKFLDLENFDKKFKLAKEESSELKSLLKKLEGVDYKRDIALAETQLAGVDDSLQERKRLVEILKKKVSAANETLCELQKYISAIPSVVVNYEEIKYLLNNDRVEKQKLLSVNDTCGKENQSLVESIAEANLFLSSVDEEALKLKEKEWNSLDKQMTSLETNLSSLQTELSSSEKKIDLLNQVPCGDKFPQCKFIKDAFTAKQTHEEKKSNHDTASAALREVSEKYSALDGEFSSLVAKLADLTRVRDRAQAKLTSNELTIEKNKNRLAILNANIENLEEKVKSHDANMAAVENYERLIVERDESKKNITTLAKELTDVEREIVELYKSQGSISAKIEIFKKQELELDDLRKQYSAYHLFLTCMHPNGISYEVIKSKLPEINQEIAKVLTNIVDFSIYLENDDDKLDIMIKHPKYDARPLEMGSGAEKTLASTAIRLALLNVTTLPVGDIFVMDEPGTALDAENLEGFTKILDLVKGYFKTVIIISHLDSLKDCVDMQIIIDKKNNFAYVNQ